uniref:Putative secreted protein n=1 Tax=Ixodes ricinus TaxID=34613 RepID=A0A6B0U925_IXORI
MATLGVRRILDVTFILVAYPVHGGHIVSVPRQALSSLVIRVGFEKSGCHDLPTSHPVHGRSISVHVGRPRDTDPLTTPRRRRRTTVAFPIKRSRGQFVCGKEERV